MEQANFFDFQANKQVDSLDTIPEQFRGVYQEITEGENTGKFGVNESVKGLITAYGGLAENNAGLRQEKKAVTDENAQRRHALQSVQETLTGLGVEIGEEGVVPAIEAFITDLQSKVKGGEAQKIDLDKIKTQFANQEAAIREETRKELDTMLASLRREMVTGNGLTAILKHKGAPKLLLAHIERQADVMKDDNGGYVPRILDSDGSVRLNAQGDPMSIEDLVIEMKTNEAFGRAFDSEVPGGTGSPPGAMQRQAAPVKNRDNLSATEKIKIGLQKGQQKGGAARGVVSGFQG